jgi:hypothetical protein
MKGIGKQLEEIIAHYEKKEYAEAEQATDKLLAVYPDFPRGQFMKAVILEETGRAADAEPHYVKAGNRFTLWSRLAMQLHDIDPKRALAYYEKAIKMDPRNNVLLLALGDLYEKTGRREDARSCYRNLSLVREVVTRIVTPIGFVVFLIIGANMMFQRNQMGLAALVIASAVFCLFWLKRDAGKAIQMIRKKTMSA